MEITEVRIKLVPPGSDKLRAFCSITIEDNFVIRDLKIIEGSKGAFVAMPSRKLTTRCSRCGGKNHYRAAYCNDCGVRLPEGRNVRGGRAKLHADIAHPINSSCRELIQKRVLASYQDELERASKPGYQPPRFDEFEEDYLDDVHVEFRGERHGSDRVAAGATSPSASPVDDGKTITAEEKPGGFHATEVPSRGRSRREADPRVGGRGPLRRRLDPASDTVGGRGRFGEAFEKDDEPLESRRPPPEKYRHRGDLTEGLEEEPEDNFGAGLFS